MPSSYTPPDVTVEQRKRTAIANASLPQLPVVVVGPARQIVTREVAGDYEAGADFNAPLPDLIEGAEVIDSSLSAFLQAVAGGKSWGLFQLSSDEFTLSEDGLSLNVVNDLNLQFSVLSTRNNNQADSTTDDDHATGTANANKFTDLDLDILARTSQVSGGEDFITISAPPEQVGRYKIYDMIPTGTAVHTVKIEMVDNDGVKIVDESFDIDASLEGAISASGSRFIYGYPETHELTGTGGDNHYDVNNESSDPSYLGIGVKAQIGSTIDGADLGNVFHAPISIPSNGSGESVVFTPDSTGIAVQAWKDLLALVKIGHFFRIEGLLGGGSALIRDFKITDFDTSTGTITIVNTDNEGSGTVSIDGGVSDNVTAIKILEVLHGSKDSTNAAGDVVTGEADSTVVFDNEILKARPGFIELIKVLPTLSVSDDTTVTIVRGVPARNKDASYDIVKRITSGFTGKILVSYQAKRLDLSLNGLIEVSDLKSVEDNAGDSHPDNPLALGGDMVTRSGLTDGTRTFYLLATDDDTLESFQTAIDELTKHDVYFIVPMTQEQAIIDVFKSHVATQSLPANKHERVLLATSVLATFDREIPVLEDDALPQGTKDEEDDKVFGADVDWSLVSAGDVLKIMSGTDQATATVLEEHRIQSVDVEGATCTLLSSIGSDFTTNIPFRVDTHTYSQLEQAEHWRDEALGIASSRVIMVRPDIMELTYTDKTGSVARDKDIIVPTYYAAAAIAGLKGSLPPQQPITNVPIPGINRIFHSNAYFIPDDLNTIAEGGNFILTQTTRTAAPYCRHQLTCDMTSLITREFSIVCLVDYSAKYIRNSLLPYIGNHNITAEYLTQLRGIAESLIRSLISDGVLMPESSLDSLIQDPDNPDTVLIEVSLNVPYPCNKIKVTLYI